MKPLERIRTHCKAERLELVHPWLFVAYLSNGQIFPIAMDCASLWKVTGIPYIKDFDFVGDIVSVNGIKIYAVPRALHHWRRIYGKNKNNEICDVAFMIGSSWHALTGNHDVCACYHKSGTVFDCVTVCGDVVSIDYCSLNNIGEYNKKYSGAAGLYAAYAWPNGLHFMNTPKPDADAWFDALVYPWDRIEHCIQNGVFPTRRFSNEYLGRKPVGLINKNTRQYEKIEI